MRSSLTCRLSLALPLVLFAACGNSPPAPPAVPVATPAPAAPERTPEPPDDPLPTLRTGSLTPTELPDQELKVVGRFVGDGREIVELELPSSFARATIATSAQPGAGEAAFVSRGTPRWQHPTVDTAAWVCRPVSDAPIMGELFVPADGTTPGKHARFHAGSPRSHASDAKARVAWLRGLASSLEGRTPWTVFAESRLRAMADSLDEKPRAGAKAKTPPRARVAPATPPAHDELASLMETTTGETAIQEALQQDRPLFAVVAKEKASLPIASLAPPPLAKHPWAKMSQRLDAPPPEPLAADVPADFYYVRAVDLPSLFHLFDQVDAWGTPAAHVLDRVSEERDLAGRYETQLALRRGPLTRALGPSVVGEVAVVGSDPYLKEGSDVTVLLRVKSRPLFEAALAGTLADLEQKHGKIAHESRTHGGVTVAVSRSADGAVAQQRASTGDVEIVSNSAGAMDAVLDTLAGQRPKLADEADFRFMLARDAKERADILAYMGDRFVSAVVGPAQKVLAARREIALGELETPGFAALLYGVMQGKSPASVDELVRAGVLAKDELTHTGGLPIAFTPGSAGRSTWGTPAAMTPLIDMPAPSLVTPSEKASYARFARSYESTWSAYVDPVAVRLAFDGQTMTAKLRELPLLDGSDYRELAGFVGAARFVSGSVGSGARAVIGIGADSEIRRSFTRRARGFSSSHALSLDFLGEWAAIGVADRAVLAGLALTSGDVPQMPEESDRRREDEFALLTRLPVYAEVAVKSSGAAALALAGVRVMASETIPGMFEWGEAGRHRDVPIVRITVKRELSQGLIGSSPEIAIFYAVTEGAIIVALQQWVLEQRIDEQLDGTAPRARPAEDPASAQLSLEVATRAGKAIASVLSWELEAGLRSAGESSRSVASALLRGAPEIARDSGAQHALALAYFGAAPVTPDGAVYAFAPEGPRDPAWGTAYAPTWPTLPVAGSPIADLLLALTRVRTDVSFDDEGKDDQAKSMRSLSARATFELAPSRP